MNSSGRRASSINEVRRLELISRLEPYQIYLQSTAVNRLQVLGVDDETAEWEDVSTASDSEAQYSEYFI
jgi:hypothetical protein